MATVTIGIDLGENLCSLAGLDEDGRVVLRKRIRRANLIPFLTTLPPATLAMEALGSSHPACCGRRSSSAADVARICPALRQSAEERQPGCEAIAEAAPLPMMRFVPLESETQLEVQTLHRTRPRLLRMRGRSGRSREDRARCRRNRPSRTGCSSAPRRR
jgi:transposase